MNRIKRKYKTANTAITRIYIINKPQPWTVPATPAQKKDPKENSEKKPQKLDKPS